MKMMKMNLRDVFKSLSLSLLTLALSVTVLYAATTIGSNIATDGTLLINNATSTVTNLAMINSTSTNATSTSLSVSAAANLSTASSTGLIKAKSLSVGSPATEASTISGLVFGFCNIPAKTIVGTSTAYVVCDTATGVLTSDRVFVQATSSLNGGGATLAGGAFVVAASSTAANTISVLLGSTGDADGLNTVTTAASLNFWAVR